MNGLEVIKGEVETMTSDQLGIISMAQGLPEGGGKKPLQHDPEHLSHRGNLDVHHRMDKRIHFLKKKRNSVICNMKELGRYCYEIN